jgi:tripartite-type tricarboxylate transporter receptor subunit TctC
MTPSMRRRACALFSAALAVAAAAPVLAADWKPEKTVTLVVPYSPGGGTDVQARHLARQLEKIWGQAVIVENPAGADGLIGTRKVIEARPDGLTLLVQLPSLTLIKHTPAYKGIDPVAQLVPVSHFAELPGVAVANAAIPAKTMTEVVAYCKTAAKPCSLGTTENIARLQASTLAAESHLSNLIVANYKGGGQLITDLVSNNVNLGLMGITAVLPHQRSGSLKVVMTFGHRRSAVLPDVPSAAEQGFPSFDVVTWYGLFAPKGTPPAIVEAVAAAVKQAVQSDELKKAFAGIGSDPVSSSPTEFATIVKKDADRYAALSKRFPLE